MFTAESIKNVGFQRIRELRDYMYENKKTDINILLSKGLTLKKQISEFEEHINFFDFKEFKAINYLYLNLENMDKDNLTIYKAKGLEFDNVILNIDTGGFRQKNWSKVNFNHSENDQREPEDVMNYLFYVGITRAKKRLFIYVNTATTGEFLSKLKTTFPNLKYIKA
ncbi:3'-5' exonuclease [Pediococcus pentosaceus]|uniref:3'-5' exonuclease n=1 Tax=Pediococcus pentosaceus TaxID=1255 RepID=UPI0013E89F20|nr:3'-5' exonuclease [Pediococcus pentosaceus]